MKFETLSNRKAVVGILAVVVALLVLIASGATPVRFGDMELLANPGGPNPGNGKPVGNGAGGNPTQKFTITGTVSGLYPNATRQLPLTLTSPAAFTVKVTKLSITAANADKVGCLRTNLIVPSFTDQPGSADDVLIPRNSQTVKTLPMRMVANPADACQGATWTLTYSGEAVQA